MTSTAPRFLQLRAMDVSSLTKRPGLRTPVVENKIEWLIDARITAKPSRKRGSSPPRNSTATPARRHSVCSPLRITAHAQLQTSVADDDSQAEVERSAWMILEHYNRCDVQGKPQVRRGMRRFGAM